MYTHINFKTKKELKEAVAKGQRLTYYSPGMGMGYVSTGTITLEGPHYPAPHKWYATAKVENDIIVSVK